MTRQRKRAKRATNGKTDKFTGVRVHNTTHRKLKRLARRHNTTLTQLVADMVDVYGGLA